MPGLGCILAFGQRIEVVKKEGGLQRDERESELRNTAVPNPWVTTGEAQMSAYIKATGIVFKTTGAVPFVFSMRRSTLSRELETRRGDMRSYIYQFTVSEDIANQFIRLWSLLWALLLPPPLSLSSAFKRNILKKTLFPDYRALYRRTRKYKFWPRHPKSYFLCLSLTVTCLHLLKDIDIMEFVMLWSIEPFRRGFL